MLKLIHAEHGRYGVIRSYQHSKLGAIQTVTTWREPGAHIIRLERESDRQRRCEVMSSHVEQSSSRRRKKKGGGHV
jgi:hypothetical protein